MNFEIAFNVAGGVGLFLFGVKLMSGALQDLAGDKMRTLISSLTSTPLKGAGVGALVTMVIHSSAATTIMVVSFVQAGMMTLKQAIGVIMGANIGTTVTAQMVAFDMGTLAMPLLGLGMMLAVFGRSKRQRYIGNGIFGFGLLCMGMETMENALAFLADKKEFFMIFARSPMLCIAAGTVLTMLVQSSTATVGLTIAMATQGLLPLQSSIAILLGNNIGTTVTAVLAALSASRPAKQAAAAHVFFNLAGVLIFAPFLAPFTDFIAATSSGVARQLANAHTLFNVVNTVIQLPFAGLIAAVIQRLIPAQTEQLYSGARFLDDHLLDTAPAAAVQAVRNELLEMGDLAGKMLDLVRAAYFENDPSAGEKLNRIEEGVDDLTHRIAVYAARLWRRHLSSSLSRLLESLVNGSSDIERIGDHAQNLMDSYDELAENRMAFSDQAMSEFDTMLSLVRNMLEKTMAALREDSVDLAREVAGVMEESADAMEKRLRTLHIQRLNDGLCSPASGVLFIEMITNLERIGDHATNVAEIVLAAHGLLTPDQTHAESR